MKGAWKYLIAGAILSAALFAGIAAAQGGSITLAKDGDIVTISGFTNLAAGDRILVNVVSAGFTPTEKGIGGGFAGAAGTVVVRQGSPLNSYSFSANVSTFPPGEYLVTVESLETTFRDSARFVLPWTPVPTGIPSPPATIPAATGTTPAPAPTGLPVTQTTPTQAHLPWIIPAGALALAAFILLRRS
jgi:hypothetical protein